MIELLSLPFFQRVLAAGLLASVAAGVLGSYVVAKRFASMSGGLAHASFGGVGLGYLLGFSPMAGATGFALLAAVAIGLAYRRLRSGLDTLVSMVWAVGMALGVVLVGLAPGYAPDLTTYLFGNLLFVPWSFVALVAAFDALVLGAVLLFSEEFQAVAFDEEFAEVTGLPVEAIFVGLLALTALGVVTLIRVVGVILAIALLTIPASIGRQWARSLGRMMAIAVAAAAACTLAGLFLSYGLSASAGVSAPPGPLVILIAAALFGLSTALRRATGGR